MIATSEVGVSMSIDNDAHLNDIVNELKKYGTVTVDSDMCIICVSRRPRLEQRRLRDHRYRCDEEHPCAHDFLRRQQLQHLIPHQGEG